MAEMSMNRAIHAAFRRDLRRFLEALDGFAAGDRDRAGQLGRAWANFDDQLVHHHQSEHETAWPALVQVGVSPELLEQMDAEHDVMAAALSVAGEAMARLVATASAQDAAAARAAMLRLQEVTVAHLDHEEATIEPVYLANVDAPAIKEMGRSFGKVSPTRGGRFLAWVTDGASGAELASIKGNVPGLALTIIGGIFGRSYRRDVAPAWRD